MMTLRILAREHAAIDAITARLEAEIDAVRATGEVDGEAVDRMLAFLEREVDGQHQEKEERAFLPRLRARANASAHVDALLEDHALQRALLADMRTELEGASWGELGALAALARLTRGYLRSQREHSRWEQRVLFPLATRLLLPADDVAIVRDFRALDQAWGGRVWATARTLERWLDERRASAAA